MKIKFSKNFKKLISTYILIYFGVYITYSFLNWFLTKYTKIIHINEKYSNYWIPIILCVIITYFVFRPLVFKTSFGEKAKDFSLWALIPFSLGFPIAFSQNLYTNYGYKVIDVENATDVLKYPEEKYFKIENFFVEREKVFVVKESHTIGRYGNELVVSNYATSAVYNDSAENNKLSKIGYGIHFSKKISNRVLDTKQEQEIIKFDSTSYNDYQNYDFYKSKFFERVFDSDDANYFKESWSRNNFSDKTVNPTVLEKMNRSLSEINSTYKNTTIYSLIFSFLVAVFFLTIFEISKNSK